MDRNLKICYQKIHREKPYQKLSLSCPQNEYLLQDEVKRYVFARAQKKKKTPPNQTFIINLSLSAVLEENF